MPEGWRWLADHYHWSERETEVAQLMVAGLEGKMIAHELDVSEETVHTHVKSLYKKTRVRSQALFLGKLAMRCPLRLHRKVAEEDSDP